MTTETKRDEWRVEHIAHMGGGIDGKNDEHILRYGHRPLHFVAFRSGDWNETHLLAYLNALEACAEALRWALEQLDRGDGVLEYTGPSDEGDNAKAALARLDTLR